MNRYPTSLTSLSILLLGTWLSAAPVPARPNMLLIIADDHAWTDYGFMGHPHLRTPSLDRLAAQSLVFPRGYVTASLCCPSLASIMTGRYPHEHRIVSNDPPLPPGLTGAARYQSPEFKAGRARMNDLMAGQPTLPRLLSQAGYLTLQTGKWWQGHFAQGGFTHGMTRGEESAGGRHGDDGLRIGRTTLQPIFDFLDLAQRESKPFFIWYAPMMPHDPHTPPDRFLRHYLALTNSLHVARYWAMVEWFDETCGQLRADLARRGLASNTIVAYLADNGWIQAADNPRFAPRSKQSPYDGGLRTPMLLHWPGRVRPERSTALASSVDLMPTLLKAAGLRPPPGLPGVNWLDRRAVRARRSVQGACFTHDAVDLDRPALGLRWRWRVEGPWKIMVPNLAQEPGGKTALFNVLADPHELRNLSEAEPGRQRRLRRSLDAWWDGRSIDGITYYR